MTEAIGRSFRGGNRALAFGLASIQIVVAGTSFLAWAAFSRWTDQEDAGMAVTAYTWAMIGYLPLSLGLPFVLPNYFRDNGRKSLERRRFTLRAIVRIALVTSGIGLILCLVAVQGAAADSLRTLGIILALAACSVVAVTGQQLARIFRRLRLMVGASAFSFVLPGAWAVLSRLGVGEYQRSCAAVLLLSVFMLALARLVSKGIPVFRSEDSRKTESPGKPVMRVSLPLVPHLVAFGLIQQGIRLMATIEDQPENQLAAHFVMIFVSAGFSLVGAFHTIFAARIQSASVADFSGVMRRNVRYYAAVGIGAGILVFAALRSPIAGLFKGMPELGIGGAIVAGIMPIILALYDFMSALFVRFERTAILAFGSVLTAAVMAVAAKVSPGSSLFQLECMYAISLLILPVVLAIWFPVLGILPKR